MPDGYGGGGEGAGGGSQGMGGLGGGNNGGSGRDRDNESAAESNRLAAANQAAANQAANQAAAAARASEARAQVDNSGLSAMSTGFQSTPENQQAIADQQTVRDFLARVEADKQAALNKPGEAYNVNDPNIGTNVTNAALAAVDSGLNQFTTQVGAGKNVEGGTRDVTTLTSNIPVAKFLGYTGEPGNAAISYGEAQQLKDLGLGNLTGVNLNNMPGTGLTVGGVTGLTYNQPGQTADSIVAATDAGEFVGKVWDAAKNFIPGYGMAQMAANLVSGKMAFGDLMVGIGLNKLAPVVGVSPQMLADIVNLDAGNVMTNLVANQAIKSLSMQMGVHPALVAMGLKETGSLDGLSKLLGVGNAHLNTTGKISNAITTGAGNFGVPSGESTGIPTNIGDTQQEQIDRYLRGSSGVSSPEAPASPASPAGTTGKPFSSLDALGAAAFGIPSYGETAAATPALLSSSYQTKLVPNQAPAQDVLAEFKNLQQADDGNANVFALKDDSTQGKTMDNTFYTYGRETPIEDILSAQAENFTPDGSGVPDYMKTGLQAATGGAIGGTRYGRYAQGGLSVPLMAHGGKMRVDFRHGDAVTGEGDGQSDDIPAMLADGEFVFPADVVAAIGNGSTKAGSDKLYDMMHGIRAHARSAKPKDLPPAIKSPLDFLKNTKRTKARS
jgi:hypothetical protein